MVQTSDKIAQNMVFRWELYQHLSIKQRVPQLFVNTEGLVKWYTIVASGTTSMVISNIISLSG